MNKLTVNYRHTRVSFTVSSSTSSSSNIHSTRATIPGKTWPQICKSSHSKPRPRSRASDGLTTEYKISAWWGENKVIRTDLNPKKCYSCLMTNQRIKLILMWSDFWIFSKTGMWCENQQGTRSPHYNLSIMTAHQRFSRQLQCELVKINSGEENINKAKSIKE